MRADGARKVMKAVTGPDKTAAPFEWNDAVPEALLIGIIALPKFDGAENLADKARKKGFRYGPKAEWRILIAHRRVPLSRIGMWR